MQIARLSSQVLRSIWNFSAFWRASKKRGGGGDSSCQRLWLVKLAGDIHPDHAHLLYPQSKPGEDKNAYRPLAKVDRLEFQLAPGPLAFQNSQVPR